MIYLEHFKLTQAPFSLTPNTDFYCQLPTHQEALNVLMLSLEGGEGFLKIIGEVGTGKTLLCRLLLNALPEKYVTAYIPNPDLSADSLRIAVAKELGLEVDNDTCQHTLVDEINRQLLKLHREGRKVVLLIDEAQCLSENCLEAVRLLTNLETEDEKLLQVVLFGQPELDARLSQSCLRQLKQRITFSYYLKPLTKDEVESYLHHRLAKAGYTYGRLFTSSAKKRLYKATGGLPRLLNIICHKSLMVAYGLGEARVTKKSIERAIKDTDATVMNKKSNIFSSWQFQVTLISVATAAVVYMYWKLGIFS